MKTVLVRQRLVKRETKSYGSPSRKQLAIPDQALSLREIVKRFVRGVPVDVKHRDPIWIDQEEFDLELLSRSEFSEKMSIAEELRQKYDEQIKRYETAKEAKRKEQERNAIREELMAESDLKATDEVAEA